MVYSVLSLYSEKVLHIAKVLLGVYQDVLCESLAPVYVMRIDLSANAAANCVRMPSTTEEIACYMTCTYLLVCSDLKVSIGRFRRFA